MVFDKLGRFTGKVAKKAAGGPLEVIKWPDHLDPERYVAWRYPKTDIKYGSVVIVDEGQKAIFFRDGKLMGVLDSGRHVLDTQNVPFLHGLVSELYGETIFKASIVFVNLRQYMGAVADRTFIDYIGGHITYKITYYYTVDTNKLELFYVRLMGPDSELTAKDVERKIAPFIKRSIIELMNEFAAQQARAGRILQNVSDFKMMLTEFSEASKTDIIKRINNQFGLNIVDIQVEDIDIAPEDKAILQMSGPRAFAAMYQRDWVGREKIAESLSKSPASGVVAPFMMFPWMMYPPMPPQQPPQPPITPPTQPGQQPPGQPPQPPKQPPPGYPPGPYSQQPYPQYLYTYQPYPQQPYPPQYPPQPYPQRPQGGQQPYPPQQPRQYPPQQPVPPGYPVVASPYQPPQQPQQPTQQPVPTQPVTQAKCPYCGRDIPLFAPVCPYCANPIEWCPDRRPVRKGERC